MPVNKYINIRFEDVYLNMYKVITNNRTELLEKESSQNVKNLERLQQLICDSEDENSILFLDRLYVTYYTYL